MKLSNIYLYEVLIPKFLTQVDEDFRGDLNEGEMDPGLVSLLGQADKAVFEKFKIKPSDKKYFIAGSARLHLDNELKDAFKVTENIGDLDIVIPDKQVWLDAGFSEEEANKGIYRPEEYPDIEVFTEWKPQIADPGKFKDKNVRDSMAILSDSTLNKGYYFMPLKDIVDYKTILDRPKEQEIIKAINQYLKGTPEEKISVLKQIIGILGGKEQARTFFG